MIQCHLNRLVLEPFFPFSVDVFRSFSVDTSEHFVFDPSAIGIPTGIWPDWNLSHGHGSSSESPVLSICQSKLSRNCANHANLIDLVPTCRHWVLFDRFHGPNSRLVDGTSFWMRTIIELAAFKRFFQSFGIFCEQWFMQV